MKFKLLYTLASVVLLFSSCEKWLESGSRTQVRGEDLLKTESGFQEALIGIYLQLASNDLYGKNLTWYFNELIGQPYSKDNEATGEMFRIASHSYNDIYVAPIIKKIWNKSYNNIALINNLLKAVEANQHGALTDDVQAMLRGELLALRAYTHLDLMRLFGYGNLNNREDYTTRYTVPYVETYSKDLTPQLPYDKTIELVVRDLKNSIEALSIDPIRKGNVSSALSSSFWAKRKVRMNYFAAKATLVRAYLWAGSDEDVAAASEIAKEIIALEGTAYTWISSQNILSNNIDRTFSCEHLFTLSMFGLVNQVNSYMTDLLYDPSAKVPIISEENVTQKIFNSVKWSEEAYEYVPGGIGYDDYRLQTHLKRTEYRLNSYFMPYKLYQSTANTYPSYNDQIALIKISEMYYAIAEQHLRSDKEDDALAVVNFMRSKRGMNNPLTTEIIEGMWSSVENELTKEYFREFIGEGQLFFYIKRKGLEAPLDAYKDNFTPAKFLLPYPADEIMIGNRVQ